MASHQTELAQNSLQEPQDWIETAPSPEHVSVEPHHETEADSETTDSKEIDTLIQAARRAVSIREADTANRLFEKARTLASVAEAGRSELDILNEWGRVNLDFENYPKAESIFTYALQRTIAVLGDGTMLAAQQHNALGGLYWTTGDYEQCFEHYQAAFKTLHEICSYFHPDTLDIMGKLGAVSLQVGELESAQSILEHSMKIIMQIHGPKSLHLPHILNNLGMTYEQLGNGDLALQCYEQALWILNNPDSDDPAAGTIGLHDAKLIQENRDGLFAELQSGEKICQTID